jgi:hypothetical protein
MTWPCEELDAVISFILSGSPTLVSHLNMGHIHSHVSKLGMDVSHAHMVAMNCVILFFLYLCFLLSTSCHYAPSPCHMIEKHIIWGKSFLFFQFFCLWWLELIYYSCLSSNRGTHPFPCFQTRDGCLPRFNDCHEGSVSLLLQVQVVWGHFGMFLLHCHADDEPVHHLSIMTYIKPCETSISMFLKLGMDLSHGSMVAMKHLLLIYLAKAQFGPIF